MCFSNSISEKLGGGPENKNMNFVNFVMQATKPGQRPGKKTVFNEAFLTVKVMTFVENFE